MKHENTQHICNMNIVYNTYGSMSSFLKKKKNSPEMLKKFRGGLVIL